VSEQCPDCARALKLIIVDLLVPVDLVGFASLAPDILAREISGSNLAWTARIDRALALLPAAGVSPEQLLSCVAQAPLPREVAATLRLIRDAPHAVSAIISDANSLYIEAVLRENWLLDAFEAGIQTNPAAIVAATGLGDDSCDASGCVTRRISVSPFCPTLHTPHNCATCSANMCKGELVRELMEKYRDATFVYVGDGGNDLCGCRQLPRGSHALPREGYPLARKLAKIPIQASVANWHSPAALFETVQRVLLR
jgi:pyridoxal phosphate phosphatase PHOSPHO2